MAAHWRMRIENNVVRGILNQCDQQLEYVLINIKTVPLLLCIECRSIPPVARRRWCRGTMTAGRWWKRNRSLLGQGLPNRDPTLTLTSRNLLLRGGRKGTVERVW